MKRAFCLFLCVILACTALCLPAQAARRSADIAPAYTPTSQEDARVIPLNLRQGYLDDTDTLQDESWTTLYNPDTAEMMVALANASSDIGKDDAAWMAVMEEYGYGQLYSTKNNVIYSSHDDYPLGLIPSGDTMVITPFRSINALIGIQEVEYNGKTRYAVAVTFRGTGDAEDLIGTDLLGGIVTDERGFHKGFSDNARDFFLEISPNVHFTAGGNSYSLEDIYDEMCTPDSDFCMLVMGHSLGGALADVLVGRYLYEYGVHPSNIAAYTIGAAPNAALPYDYPYENIYNIISRDDLVPWATIYFNKQLGTNIYFSPDDDFRRAHYGLQGALIPDMDHLWWQSAGFATTLFKPHLIKTAYEPIVDLINAEVTASTAENPSRYTRFSTCGYNDWGSGEVVINPYTFGDFPKDVRVGRTLIFEGGGVLQVAGDLYTGNSLHMHHKNDYLLVEGDTEFAHGVHEARPLHLTAGTVELKGDLSTGKYSFWRVPYHATGTHRTVLSGTKPQNINFYGDLIAVENLYIRNPKVTISGMAYARLAEDVSITHSPGLYVQQLDLNGYTLEQEGSMGVHTLTMGGGGLQVSGDVEIHTITALDGGMSVGGNFETPSTLPFNKGIMRVAGDCYLPATLIMQNEEDYLYVGGDLTIYARDWDEIPDDHLSAGTVEIKGDFDFDDMGRCTANAYHETGTHKTILSGDGPQVLWWSNKASPTTRFENLCIRNPLTSLVGVPHVRLGEDAAVALLGDNTLPFWEIDGILDPGGHTLTLSPSDSTAKGKQLASIRALSYPDGGKVDIDGSLKLFDGTLQGDLTVSGDLTLDGNDNGRLVLDGGRLTVGGDCYLPRSLVMDSEDDYLFVGGNLTVETDGTLTEDHLKAGTVELQGDLRVYESRNQVAYCATGTHRTIFSGTGEQRVSMGGMHDHKRLQACLRNPDTVLEAVHTLKLMEGGALNHPENCRIYGTLDLNGYPLRLSGTFALVKEIINGQPIGVEVEKTESGDSEITVICPELPATAPNEAPAAIHVLFTGFDDQFRMIVCETLTFTSESEARQTVTLAQKLWGDCTYISAFWLEKDFAPFCTAMAVDM